MKRFIGATILSLSGVPVMISIGLTISYLFQKSDLFPEIDRRSNNWNTMNMAISLTPAIILGCIYWVAIWAPMVRWTKKRFIGTSLLILTALTIALNYAFYGMSYDSTDDKIAWANALFAVIFILGSIPIWKRTKKDHLAHLDDRYSYPPLKNVILCPSCRTDMTNLEELICPGCEKHYSIDELLSAATSAKTQDNTQLQINSQGAGQ